MPSIETTRPAQHDFPDLPLYHTLKLRDQQDRPISHLQVPPLWYHQVHPARFSNHLAGAAYNYAGGLMNPMGCHRIKQ